MNQAELQNDHATITSKMIQFMVILFLDLFSNSNTMFMLFFVTPIEPKIEVNRNLQNTMLFVYSGICAFAQFLLIFWQFTLLWKTFPFRQGDIGRLYCREFPLLMLIPFQLFLILGEKSFRIVSDQI